MDEQILIFSLVLVVTLAVAWFYMLKKGWEKNSGLISPNKPLTEVKVCEQSKESLTLEDITFIQTNLLLKKKHNRPKQLFTQPTSSNQNTTIK